MEFYPQATVNNYEKLCDVKEVQYLLVASLKSFKSRVKGYC